MIMNCKAGQTENSIVYCLFSVMKKLKNEEKKIAHCLFFFYKEAATGGALQKKVSLKISKNSQESNCVRMSYF